MSNPIADETREHGCDADTAVVGFETEGLLGGGVPHAHYENEAGVYGRLEGAEEEAVGRYAGEGGACWTGEEDGAPADYGYGEETACG